MSVLHTGKVLVTHDFTPERENHSTPAPWFRILSLTGGLNPTQANDGFLVVMEKKMEATRDNRDYIGIMEN